MAAAHPAVVVWLLLLQWTVPASAERLRWLEHQDRAQGWGVWWGLPPPRQLCVAAGSAGVASTGLAQLGAAAAHPGALHPLLQPAHSRELSDYTQMAGHQALLVQVSSIMTR